MKVTLANVVGSRAKSHSDTCHHYHDYNGLSVEANEEWSNGELKCDACGQMFEAHHCAPKYDTASGELEPGSMYWADYLPENTFWDNHKGPHLHVVLPNGHHWNIDSRASNCGLPSDRTHRCWVRHGTPPNITVDKAGHTCVAGAGSIQAGDWHGFLRNGELHL